MSSRSHPQNLTSLLLQQVEAFQRASFDMWRRLLCSWQGAVSPDEDSGEEKPVEKGSDPAGADGRGGMGAKAGGGEARQPQATMTPAAGSLRRDSSGAASDAPPAERRVPPLEEALVLLAEARRRVSPPSSLLSSRALSRARCRAHRGRHAPDRGLASAHSSTKSARCGRRTARRAVSRSHS